MVRNKIYEQFMLAIILIYMFANTHVYGRRRLTSRDLDCPPNNDIIEERDPFAPVVSVPSKFYADEQQKAWVSIGRGAREANIIVQFYFANDLGYILDTECFSTEISDDGNDDTTFVDIVFPLMALENSQSTNVSLVTRWCHGSRRCDEWYENRKDITIVSELRAILIQTNKGVFNPSQSVVATIYTLDRHLKPVATMMEVDFIGPNGVIYERTKAATKESDYGVIRLQFPFPTMAIFGIWTLRAKYGVDMLQHSNTTVVLKNYRLPVFLVDIAMDDVVIIDDWNVPPIQATVSARHVFGTPVQGNLSCSSSFVTRKQTDDPLESRVGIESGNTQSTVDLFNGDGTYDVNLNMLHNTRVNLNALVLYVQCNVTECVSGITETASREAILTMKETMYSVSFDSSAKLFNPGLPYLLQGTITDVKGDAVKSIVCNVSIFENGDTPRTIATYPAVSDVKGRIAVLIDTSNTSQLMIRMAIADMKTNHDFIVNRAHHVANEYLSIVPEEGNIFNPDEFVVHATHPNSVRSLYILYIVRHSIWEQKKEEFAFFTNPYKFNFDFSGAPAPEIELLVLYTKDDGSIVSDSIKIQTEQRCSSIEKFGTNSTIYQPKDVMSITYTGYKDSAVVTQAIDVAALALARNAVTLRQKLYEVLNNEYKSQADVQSSVDGFLISPSMVEHRVRRHTKSGDFNRPTASPEESENIIDDCCEWGRQQEWNSVTAPCEDIIVKLIPTTTLLPVDLQKCMKEAYNCCTEVHDTSGEVEYDYYIYDQAKDYGESSIIDPEQQTQPIKRDINVFVFRGEAESVYDEELRQDFRETMVLPMQVITNTNRNITLVTRLPDSLTSWQIETAFLNTGQGMCIPPTQTIDVRKDAFVRVHLPDKIVVGEYVEITAIVYNNLETPLVAFLRLEDVSIELCHDRRNISVQYAPIVQAHDKMAKYWVLVPNKVGLHNFTVRLVDESNGKTLDRVNLDLDVQPAGFSLQERPDVTILRPGANYSVEFKIPSVAVEDSIKASLQLDGNLFRPNIETMGAMYKHELHLRPEDLLIHVASLFYTLQYMENEGHFKEADMTHIKEELQIGIETLLQYQSPKHGCFMHSTLTTSGSSCNVRLTKYAALMLIELLKSTLIQDDYTTETCNAMFYIFYHLDHSEKEKACLFKMMNRTTCDFASHVPSDDGMVAEIIKPYIENEVNIEEMCRSELDEYQMMLKQKSDQHFEDLRSWLNDWSTQIANTEQYQTMALKMEEVSTEDIEDAAWMLYTSTDSGNGHIADSLASWIVSHRNDYGAFVSYSDTFLALKAIYAYTRMISSQNLRGNICSVSSMDRTGTEWRIIEEIELEDPSVAKTVDLSSVVNDKAIVQCSGRLVFMQTFLTYKAESGGTFCPFNITVQAERPPQRPRGRRRGKRASDCGYDPNTDVRKHRNRFEVEVRIQGLNELINTALTSFDNVDIAVSLFSGYQPDGNYLNKLKKNDDITNWQYVPSNSSVLINVRVPEQKDELIVKFRKSAASSVSNIQPGLVTVQNAENGVQCSVLYHPNEAHPLLETACG